MLVPVYDRPSVAEPTETQDRAVMESRSAPIHRKMPIPARQLPITEFAHKAGIVGDALVRAVLAALDVAAEREVSIADMTFSWPRLIWPALALRHAAPWA